MALGGELGAVWSALVVCAVTALAQSGSAAALNNRVNRRFVLIVAAAWITNGCRSEPRSDVKPGTVGWRPIESWSGHENTQTESFNIESGQLRIKWETKNEASPGAGKLKVMVRSAVSGRPIALAVEHQGVGKDTAYVSDEPRLYFLEIESSGVDWTVKVEEAVVAGGAIQP